MSHVVNQSVVQLDEVPCNSYFSDSVRFMFPNWSMKGVRFFATHRDTNCPAGRSYRPPATGSSHRCPFSDQGISSITES